MSADCFVCVRFCVSRRKCHELLDVKRLNPVGGMSIKVDWVNEKFVVSVASQFTFDQKHAATTSISGIYENDFSLVSEKRFETLYSQESRHVRDNQLYMYILAIVNQDL